MALLTVGAGSLLLGQGLLGALAVELSWALWFAGTVAGLVSAVSIPYLMFTRFELTGAAVFGGWLMPIVPPMVSAATGGCWCPTPRPANPGSPCCWPATRCSG
jgi:tellurite resistance protein TehA-like permease